MIRYVITCGERSEITNDHYAALAIAVRLATQTGEHASVSEQVLNCGHWQTRHTHTVLSHYDDVDYNIVLEDFDV